jgi:hypothetical protein
MWSKVALFNDTTEVVIGGVVSICLKWMYVKVYISLPRYISLKCMKVVQCLIHTERIEKSVIRILQGQRWFI